MSMRAGFLWSLIVSLCLAAGLGILALLLPALFPQTKEILWTALIIAGASLTCFACSVALERGRVVSIAWIGMAASIGAAACWLYAVWIGLSWRPSFATVDWWVERIGGSLQTIAVWGALLSLLAVRATGQLRVRWPLHIIACMLSALALLMLYGVWFTFDAWWVEQAFISTSTLLGWSAWMMVLMLVSCKRKRSIVLARITVGVGTVLAGFILLLIWEFVSGDDFAIRLLSALIILTACGTLIVPILGLLDRHAHRASLQSVSQRLKIDLTCPRCGTRQELTAGHASCGQCGLRIEIGIEEPRCTCGYLVYQLKSENCPECGKALPMESRWIGERKEARVAEDGAVC